MKKVTALVILLFAVLLTACGAPQDLGTRPVSQELRKGMEASNRGDFPTALREFRPLAERGDADAQLMLGLMYAEGQGVPQDYAEAAKWYLKSAEQGQAVAQFNLGFMYAEGQGVPQDYAEAAKWYRKAAERGHASAQNNLGHLYESGLGVGPDDAEAKKWYRKAAAQGNENAQRNLVMVGRSPSDRIIQDLLYQVRKKAN